MPSDQFLFGACEVRPSTRELIRGGRPEDIQPRAFDLLLYLIENPGRVVGKEELLDHVWGRSIVSESVVARTVMKARKAIGDDASEPHFIVTQHGRGYRFIGELIHADASPAGSTTIPLFVGSECSGHESESTMVAAKVGGRCKDRDHVSGWFRPIRARKVPRWQNWTAVVAVILLVVGAVFLHPKRAVSEDSVRVAVLPVVNATGQDALGWIQQGLAGVLSRSLNGESQVESVMPGDVASALNTVGVMEVDSALSEKDRVVVRKKLAAGILVEGRLRKTGGEFHLDMDVYDDDGDETRTTFSGADPVELAAKAGTQIVELQKIPERMPPVAKSADWSPYMHETYARALDAMAREHFSEAARLFQIVVNARDGQLQPKLDFARALLRIRQFHRSATIADEAAAAAKAQGDDLAHARALLIKSRASYRLDNFDESESSARQALALASPESPGIKPDAELQLGMVALRRHQKDEAQLLVNAAIMEYQRTGSDYHLAAAYLEWGEAMQGLDAEAAVLHYNRALELGQRGGRHWVPAKALAMLAEVNLEQDDCQQALDRLDRAVLLFAHVEDRLGQAGTYLTRGRCEKNMGRLDAATHSFQKAIELEQGGDDPGLSAVTLLYYTNTLAAKWGVKPVVSAETLRRMAATSQSGEAPEPAIGMLLNLVQNLVRKTDRYEALAPLQRQIENLSQGMHDPSIKVGAIVLRGMLAYRQKRPADAAVALEQARTAAGMNTRMWVDAGTALMWIHLETGELGQAEAIATSMTTITTGYPTLCIVRARLLYEQKQFRAALKKQDDCLRDYSSSMHDADRAYRASYAAAAKSGKRSSLPDKTPAVLWL